tara:strand:+ start:293 stop:550 length:258 start_codon:yes stop_codon:yes gene_type:complete
MGGLNMDLKKLNWYNGAVCSLVLASTAPNDKKLKECLADYEDAVNNLVDIIRAELTKDAKYFLESDQKIFNTWYRKNINSKMKET